MQSAVAVHGAVSSGAHTLLLAGIISCSPPHHMWRTPFVRGQTEGRGARKLGASPSEMAVNLMFQDGDAQIKPQYVPCERLVQWPIVRERLKPKESRAS